MLKDFTKHSFIYSLITLLKFVSHNIMPVDVFLDSSKTRVRGLAKLSDAAVCLGNVIW